jgi:hypothetical protein
MRPDDDPDDDPDDIDLGPEWELLPDGSIRHRETGHVLLPDEPFAPGEDDEVDDTHET